MNTMVLPYLVDKTISLSTRRPILPCSKNHLSQFRMVSVQAGRHPFGVHCRRLHSGEGIVVEGDGHGLGHSLVSNRL